MKGAILLAALAGLGACAFEGGGIAPFRPAPAPVAERDLEVPYVPTPEPVVAAMLDLAEVGPDDHLIDLGSGDGRIALAAGRRGARALGVDLDPARVAEGAASARMAGLEHRVRFRRQDLFATPIGEADVVTLYLLPSVNLRLRPRLLTELRPGARLVSHAFAMGDWAPDAHRIVDGRDVYLWIVPAVVGGRWELREGEGDPVILELDQRFQEVSGTLAGAPLSEIALRGTRLRLRVDSADGPRTYDGIVDDAAIVAEDGAWRARRLD